MTTGQYYNWTTDDLIEVVLEDPQKYNLVAETLSRTGIPSTKEKVLNQTCHIINADGRFFIVHFKELYALDGRNHTITLSDIRRRNRIIAMLEKWNVAKVKHPEKINNFNTLPDNIITVQKSDVENWTLKRNYEVPLVLKNFRNIIENISLV